MRSKGQVIIIGLGLAGLSAARTLSLRGIDVLLMDEHGNPGGQYLRRISRDLGVDSRPVRERLKRFGYRLIKDLQHRRVTLRQGTQILGLEADGCIWARGKDGRIERYQGEQIILATGARERFTPFPGWTLPGVISTGAAQILIKSAGILPGRTHLIGGTGPLPLAVAGDVCAVRGHVQAYWNQASWSRQLHMLSGCRRHFPKLTQGMCYLVRLLASRTPLFQGCKILKAQGDGILEQVVLVKMDRTGRAIPGRERIFNVDCLAVGYGFVPNLELAMLAGCELGFDTAKGGWIVKADDNLQSSVPSIIAAGELTGIAGAEKSIVEGHLAGLTVARKIGVPKSSADQKELARLQKLRQREMAFGALLNTTCGPPRGLLQELPDSTIICRCEDINMGQIRRQIRNGFATLDALKKSTNSGMGNCQGRTCGPIIHDILGAYAPLEPKNQPPYTVRNPIKPVPLSVLAEWEDKDL